MIRRRERILIGRKIDIPLQKEGECLSYDSIRQYCDAYETRAKVDIISRSRPSNGSVNVDRATHKFTVLKRQQFTINMEIIWLDGIMPRRLMIDSVKDHETNRRLVKLYAREIAFGEATDSRITSYGDKINHPISSNEIITDFY